MMLKGSPGPTGLPTTVLKTYTAQRVALTEPQLSGRPPLLSCVHWRLTRPARGYPPADVRAAYRVVEGLEDPSHLRFFAAPGLLGLFVLQSAKECGYFL